MDPSIPPAVDGFLRKLHAKDRKARFANADEASIGIQSLLEKENVEKIDETFRAFLKNPPEFVDTRNARLAKEAAASAQKLLADKSAPPEEALWAAYRTVAVAPDDPEAQALLKTAALRAGQREKPIDNAKIRELEELLKRDPDNLSLLLQLAKLYRLERDFINLMRFFRKLQSIAPGDAYTQGQIAALVPPALGADRSPRAGTGPRCPDTLPSRGRPAPEARPEPRGTLLTLGGTAVLVALVVFVARGPTTARNVDPARARTAIAALKGATIATAPASFAPPSMKRFQGASLPERVALDREAERRRQRDHLLPRGGPEGDALPSSAKSS